MTMVGIGDKGVDSLDQSFLDNSRLGLFHEARYEVTAQACLVDSQVQLSMLLWGCPKGGQEGLF